MELPLPACVCVCVACVLFMALPTITSQNRERSFGEEQDVPGKAFKAFSRLFLSLLLALDCLQLVDKSGVQLLRLSDNAKGQDGPF